MAPPQWAYQVENYVNEPDEELVCSICRSVFCEPVMCPCDHVFCRNCISKWLQNNRNCPICRKRASNSSIKQNVPIVKNIIMKLLLKCHNKSLGCKAQFSVESSEGHTKECEYEFVQCKNKPCKDKLFRKDIAEHEASDCPHRHIKCTRCGSKMPTTEVPEKHDCIRALQLRIRKKNVILRKRDDRITELKNENKALKAASQGSGHPMTSSASRSFMHPLGSSTLSSLSPDEIMINITGFESSSSSDVSDSDDSSENSIIIFTNSPLDHSDNGESESFTSYMADSIEYPRNENVRDTSEYRNAESQTTGGNIHLNDQQSNIQDSRNGNPTCETDSVTVEVPDSVFGETENRSQQKRQIKRRPTTQKPAKRRLPPLLASSSDESDNNGFNLSRLSKHWKRQQATADENRSITKVKQREGGDHADLEAGPSSVSLSGEGSSTSTVDASSRAQWDFYTKAKLHHKNVKQAASFAGDNAMSSRVGAPSRGNAVFERTLALLEQYNLESDPEWLPEFASHTGDTPSDEESSDYSDESSSSEASDSVIEGNSNVASSEHNLPGASEFMHWMFDSTSEEDPDWVPPVDEYLEDDENL